MCSASRSQIGKVVGSNPITPTLIMSYKLYILQSLTKDRYYIGHTNNIERRLSEHNSGQTKSTKAYIPWKLVFLK